MKAIDLKAIHILTLINRLILKILNFRFVIISKYQNTKEYQNTKTFLLIAILQKKTFKNTVPSRYAVNDLNGEHIIESFCEK